MFDAISNFIVYLEECIRDSTDLEEISRLSYVLDQARTLRDKVAAPTAPVQISS